MAEWDVIASADDANENSGTVTITATDANVDDEEEYHGFRFQNVAIPQGSTIDTAFLTLYCPSSSEDDPNHDIFCEDDDDASEFTTGASDISNRIATTADVNWDNSNLGAPGSFNTPSLVSIVQEVVDRPGWSSGNAMVFIVVGSLGSRDLRVSYYDHATDPAPKLTITWTEPAAKTISVSDILGIPTQRFRQLDWDRSVAANLGLSDSVSVGVIRTISVSDNLGVSDSPTLDQIVSSQIHDVPAVSDNLGMSDNVLLDVNYRSILVSENLGMSTVHGPPDIDAPDPYFKATLECVIVFGCSLNEKQQHTSGGSTIQILAGARYRR